jgi:hypothetical protein
VELEHAGRALESDKTFEGRPAPERIGRPDIP